MAATPGDAAAAPQRSLAESYFSPMRMAALRRNSESRFTMALSPPVKRRLHAQAAAAAAAAVQASCTPLRKPVRNSPKLVTKGKVSNSKENSPQTQIRQASLMMKALATPARGNSKRSRLAETPGTPAGSLSAGLSASAAASSATKRRRLAPETSDESALEAWLGSVSLPGVRGPKDVVELYAKAQASERQVDQLQAELDRLRAELGTARNEEVLSPVREATTTPANPSPRMMRRFAERAFALELQGRTAQRDAMQERRRIEAHVANLEQQLDHETRVREELWQAREEALAQLEQHQLDHEAQTNELEQSFRQEIDGLHGELEEARSAVVAHEETIARLQAQRDEVMAENELNFKTICRLENMLEQTKRACAELASERDRLSDECVALENASSDRATELDLALRARNTLKEQLIAEEHHHKHAMRELEARIDVLKENYFFSTAIAVKLSESLAGFRCNTNVQRLYEETVTQDVPLEEWPVWIRYHLFGANRRDHPAASMSDYVAAQAPHNSINN